MMPVMAPALTPIAPNSASSDLTVGIKRDELLDFVKLCREVATRANNVVRIIDEAGKDAMSMAYAELEEGIGESMLDGLRNKVEAYGNSPAGRKYFYGEH